MKTARLSKLLSLAVLWAAASSLPGQDASPPLDERDFVPPRAVLTMTAPNVDPLIHELVAILQNAGFRLTDKDWTRGYMTAAKADGDNVEDRIMIHLYRDIEKPDKVLVFVDYAQYRKIFGKPGLRRVQATDALRNAKIGPLIAKITNLGASQ